MIPGNSLGFALLLTVLLTSTPTLLHPMGGTVARLSVTSTGEQVFGSSQEPAVSTDGRFVAFSSRGDFSPEPGGLDVVAIYVHDRQTGVISLESVASDGTQGDWDSDGPVLSGDGRYVAFSSIARNLVSNDTNEKADVFLHDRQTGTTTRLSVASNGTQSDENSFWVDISADGRYVVFMSEATNLVAGDTNGSRDIFLHDRLTSTTRRVSIDSDGAQANNWSEFPKISDNGQVVVFRSNATNLVGTDANGVTSDVFAHSLTTGITTLISVASNGTQGNEESDWSEISEDGRYIAFRSRATNLVPGGTAFQRYHLYVRDQQAGTTTLESVSPTGAEGNSYTWASDISPDGTYIVLFSRATNLVSNDTNDAYDVILRNRLMGTNTLVSVTSDGAQGNYGSGEGKVVGDAAYVVFSSGATNLVAGDTNNETDIFLATIPGIPTAVTVGLFKVDVPTGDAGAILAALGVMAVSGIIALRGRRPLPTKRTDK